MIIRVCMSDYKDIVDKYINSENEQFDKELEKELDNADTTQEKAKILLRERLVQTQWKMFIGVILVIVIGNIILDPPMLYHSHGHFGFITHPINTLKECYFGWGANQDKFIFSITGLRQYLSAIPYIYHKIGFLKATFAYFTQFSPLWAFVPIILLLKGIFECVEEQVLSHKEGLAQYLEETSKKEKANE